MSSYFSVNLPIFKLDENNKMIIPENVKNIWFDVGTSFNSPNSIQFLNRNKDGFVLGFEPDPRMYFGLYTIHNYAENLFLLDPNHKTAEPVREKRRKRGNEHLFTMTEYLKNEDIYNRYIIIPTAIGIENDNKNELWFDEHHGSSSLLEDFSIGNTKKSIKVAKNNLEKFIKMIPERFEYIDHLKVDAEGYDKEVLESAGDYLNKFVIITTEMDLTRYMLTKNFRFIKRQNGGLSYVNKKYEHLVNKIDYLIRV